jgi:hypothetical protein
MTRTHVDEGELVDLQRKALKVFQWLDQISERYPDSFSGPYRLAQSDLALLEDARALAREVSVAVDDLTEFVRHSRCIDDVFFPEEL